eukprot:gnl/Trimastix_PCT/4131.p2 GENE.gnl/Trimastix_PCT/4131~~gnl/Trimastix_PCT/4131.p2  ORF type:complete len:264 (-),score=92.69 gnl/Trimastix_PCT/4131:50-841(-)
MQPTQLLHLTRDDLEGEANLLGLEPAEPSEDGDDLHATLFLDQTVFHPQGGGQPADVGDIALKDAPAHVFRVSEARNRDGVVHHTGSFASAEAKLAFYRAHGVEVRLVVDAAARALHTRLHSAGHLLDVCVRRIGLALLPTKGYHFPNSPFVEYAGKIPAAEREPLIARLQEEVDRLVGAETPFTVRHIDPAELEARCEFVPAHLPPGPVRVVTVQDTEASKGCPCGGTHVACAADLRGLRIERIRVKGKTTRVSYSLPQDAA